MVSVRLQDLQINMTDLVVGTKKVGQTPLSLIDEFRAEYPELKDQTIGYAGRLDPMAEGLVLLLLNEKNKERSRFERIRKVYETDVIFGLSSDTFDTLGIAKEEEDKQIVEDELQTAIKSFIGKQEHAYPPFSSPRVGGKALWQWAKEGKISEITIPKKQIEVYDAQLISLSSIESALLLDHITTAIKTVTGDFRQEETIANWESLLKKKTKTYQVATIRFDVSSGTYIRSLDNRLGKLLGTGALALRILRETIGKIELDESKKFRFVTEEELF